MEPLHECFVNKGTKVRGQDQDARTGRHAPPRIINVYIRKTIMRIADCPTLAPRTCRWGKEKLTCGIIS